MVTDLRKPHLSTLSSACLAFVVYFLTVCLASGIAVENSARNGPLNISSVFWSHVTSLTAVGVLPIVLHALYLRSGKYMASGRSMIPVSAILVAVLMFVTLGASAVRAVQSHLHDARHFASQLWAIEVTNAMWGFSIMTLMMLPSSLAQTWVYNRLAPRQASSA